MSFNSLEDYHASIKSAKKLPDIIKYVKKYNDFKNLGLTKQFIEKMTNPIYSGSEFLHHQYLIDFGVVKDGKNARTNIKALLENPNYNFQIDIDYLVLELHDPSSQGNIITKKEYKIHPDTFQKILMLSKNTTDCRLYYLLINKAITSYSSLYHEVEMLKAKDIENQKTSEIERLIRKLDLTNERLDRTNRNYEESHRKYETTIEELKISNRNYEDMKKRYDETHERNNMLLQQISEMNGKYDNTIEQLTDISEQNTTLIQQNNEIQEEVQDVKEILTVSLDNRNIPPKNKREQQRFILLQNNRNQTRFKITSGRRDTTKRRVDDLKLIDYEVSHIISNTPNNLSLNSHIRDKFKSLDHGKIDNKDITFRDKDELIEIIDSIYNDRTDTDTIDENSTMDNSDIIDTDSE